MTRFLRIGNRVVTLLLRMGLPVGRMALITVEGRRTHLPRTTPVALTRQGEGWLLVAVSGRAEWVRNLQKAGEGTISAPGFCLVGADHPAGDRGVLRNRVRGTT